MSQCVTPDALVALHGPPHRKVQWAGFDVWHYPLGAEDGKMYSIHVSVRRDEPIQVVLFSEPVKRTKIHWWQFWKKWACKFTIVAFLGLLLSVHKVIAETGALSDQESTYIRQRLESYDKGDTDYDQLFGQEPKNTCNSLAAYYFEHTNHITLKMKLPISRSLGVTHHFKEAASLATEYLSIYTNDWRGWRVLGLSKCSLKDYNGAVDALTNAASLGDDENYFALVGAAISANRVHDVDNYVTAILKRRYQSETAEDERLDLVTVLTVYANKANRPDILLRGLRGISAKQIASRWALKQLVMDSSDIFKDNEEVARLCAELKSDPDWEPAKAGTTNAVPAPEKL